MAVPELHGEYLTEGSIGHTGDFAQVFELPLPPQEQHSRVDDALHIPFKVVRGIGRAVRTLRGQPTYECPPVEYKLIDVRGYNHLVLVTEPDQELCDNPQEATNDIVLPGLSEMSDKGSAYFWHQALAAERRDHRVITFTSDGVSSRGQLLPLQEAAYKPFEIMAYDRLDMLPKLVHDGPVNPIGTSAGSVLAMHMAQLDLLRPESKQLRMEQVALVASAVIACNVNVEDNFRDEVVDEIKMRSDLTNNFFKHIPGDLVRMLRHHPEDLIRCAGILGEYALRPHKAPARALAIANTLKNVQRGVDWGTISNVASERRILVLGGELDPLAQAQVSQWDAVANMYPGQVRQRLVANRGHCMTVDARGIAKELAGLESETA